MLDAQELMDQIREENKAYRADKPIVTDPEYDNHLNMLSELITPEEFDAFLETLMEEAGDISFGDYVIGSLRKLKHEDQELVVWLTKMNILQWVFTTAKIDGCSFVAKYRGGKFSSCSSRGDGAAGTDWTEKARYILPATIPDTTDVDLRGEFTLTGNSHEQLGYKNRRNGTVGIMNSDDIEPDKLKHVKAFGFQILNPKKGEEGAVKQFKTLIALGFNVAAMASFQITDNIEDVLKNHYEQLKETVGYDIDGLVLCAEDWTNENDKFFPTGKVAYKINSEGIPAKIIGMRWNLTKGRLYFPTYLLEPTEIEGVTVSKATANNTKMMMRLGVGTGSTGLFIRSGCVIPKLVGVVSTVPYEFPTHCPECKTEFVWNKKLDTKTGELVDGVHLMCPNVHCGEAKRVESFIKALEIENVSYKRLVEWGINTFEDLLAFEADPKAKLQVAFVKDMESKLFNQPKHILLRSMKFDGFGTTNFDKLYESRGEDLQAMTQVFVNPTCYTLPEGIGVRTIEKAADDWMVNIQILNNITADPRYKEPAPVAKVEKGEGCLSGTFLFTGELSQPRRHFEKIVVENGGTLVSSVSKKLNYLIVGADAGSKLEKAEKLGTVKVLTESQFMAMLA